MTDNGPKRSRLAIGSDEHKRLFCRTFVETHEAYEPRALPWPDLDADSLARLRALPIWNHALQAETNAGVMVSGFAATIGDPVIREAVALQGLEEERHGRVIALMVERYGLDAKPALPVLQPTEPAFIHFGYRECLDSFIGFGGFRYACESRFMPETLTSLFARVLWEEARHIVFFANWVSYQRVQRGYGGPFLSAVSTAVGYVRAVFDMILSGRELGEATAAVGSPGSAPSLSGLSILRFLELALEENDRLMQRFDERLLRPQVIPVCAKIALDAVRTGMQMRDAVVARAAG